jgi:acetoin utilization deacetylase AcuC-like enzyme
VSALVVVDQRPTRDVAAPWILEGGRPVVGREGGPRLSAVREGIARHAGARPEAATADDAAVEHTLARIHDPVYLATLDAIVSDVPELRPDLAAPGMEADVPVCGGLIQTAREGVRTAITAAERVAEGAPFAYAVSRPPGHHAGPAWFGGYCYLNTAAAAALTLLDRGVAAVGILDLDLHYPNGTAAVVAPHERIHLCSLHASPVANAPDGLAVPHSEREHLVGFAGVPSADAYVDAVADAVARLAASVDAVVVSLGYDTVADDPHGSWDLPPAVFARVGATLAASGLPLCVVQEGGYGVPTLADCSHAFVSGLLEDVDPTPAPEPDRASAPEGDPT